MPSPEHEFLTWAALDAISNASKSQLFKYCEAGRKKFDFACDITRVWSKAISGQTIWKHDRDGIDKDLRTLLSDPDSSANVYVARDSMKTRARLSEVVSDYRNSPMRDRLARLRVFWIPEDFDADNEVARLQVKGILDEEIRRDLLMHVALGGLNSEDVLNVTLSRRFGMPIWMLAYLASNPVGNYTRWKKDTDFSVAILKEEALRLELSGMVDRAGGFNSHEWDFAGWPSIYRLTEKGKAMLDIASRLHDQMQNEFFRNKEFEHICRLLGIHHREYDLSAFYEQTEASLDLALHHPTAMLLAHIAHASESDRVDWPVAYYDLPEA
ncbi:hypothetical protein [Nocardiopsis listeri]|uniref:hypothetical protein n=1 Tax=Nocardiopsis listeri TaxID=53440 RepID=UPI000B1C227B|nr:hypothetical protein [Nocardiopsis listeri]